MTVDEIMGVLDQFSKRLSVPESRYKFVTTSNNEIVEFALFVDDELKCSLKISGGDIKVLYADEYKADNYASMEYNSSIGLLYYLCVLFYAQVKDVVSMDLEQLLGVLLFEDVTDWKTLAFALCENMGMKAEIVNDSYLDVEGVELHYNSFTNEIRIGTTPVLLSDDKYMTLMRAVFDCVEYIAVQLGVENLMFNVPQEEETEDNNVIEGGQGGGDTNIDVDVEAPAEGGEGAAEDVEPMETETFEKPQGDVVTMDDLL